MIVPVGGTVTEEIPFASLIGSLCLMAIGFMSIFVGYSQVVHDWGNKVRKTAGSVRLEQSLLVKQYEIQEVHCELYIQASNSHVLSIYPPKTDADWLVDSSHSDGLYSVHYRHDNDW